MLEEVPSVFSSLNLDNLLFVDTFAAQVISLDELQSLNTVMGALVLLLFALIGVLVKKIQYSKLLEEEVEMLSKRLRDGDKCNDEVMKEYKKIRETVQMKDQFIFVATHELRSTANAILWGVKELQARSEHVPKSDKTLFTGVLDSSERLLQLVNDLSEVARIEGKRMQFNVKPVDLSDILSKVIIQTRPLAREKKITIHHEIPKGFPRVLADPVRLQEVFINLLTNAIKYSSKGDDVRVFAEEKGAHVEVHVKDNGIGIALEDQPHLFEKFWRAQEVHDIEGTGLGLFIVKQMVELMSGKIWCESKKGVGSTFSFLLDKVR